MDYNLIIWDWNGTLIDDLQISIDAVNDMMDVRGLPRITKEQYHSYIDTPIINFYRHVLSPNELNIDKIVPEFNRFYFERIKQAKLMAGAVDALEYYKSKGIKQVILSSTSNDFLQRDTTYFGISHYFAEMCGADDLHVTGKCERGVKMIAKLGLQPAQCLLIGDTLHDVETADKCGCDCILIANGHQSFEDLSMSGKTVLTDIRMLIK